MSGNAATAYMFYVDSWERGVCYFRFYLPCFLHLLPKMRSLHTYPI